MSTWEQDQTDRLDRCIIELLAATVSMEAHEREEARGWLAELAIVSAERHNGGPFIDRTDDAAVRQ